MRRVAWILTALLCSQPLAAEEERKIAVLDLVAKSNIPQGTVDLLNELLLTEVHKTGGFSVLGSSDIASIMTLEEQKIQVTGCADNACLAEIGGALGVNLLMASSVGAVGNNYLLNIKIVDTSTASVVNRVSEVVEKDDNKLIATIKRTVHVVMAPLTGEKAEAQPPASSPQSPGDEGPASSVSRPAGEEATAAATSATTADATATAAVKQDKGFLGVAPWITLGIAGAAAIAGGVAIGLGMSDYSSMDNEFRKSEPWNDLRDSGDTKLVAGEVLIGVALAAGVGTVILFLVGPNDEAPVVAVGPIRGGAAATVGWTFDLGVSR